MVERFSVAYNATVLAGGVDPADVVAVLGGGPIGLLCVMAAAANNATVVLLEPQPGRRDKALQIGARAALDPTADDFADGVADLTDGRGFDVVIEAAGSPAAMAQALEVAGQEARMVYVGINVGVSVPAQLGLIQSGAANARPDRVGGSLASHDSLPCERRRRRQIDRDRDIPARRCLGCTPDAARDSDQHQSPSGNKRMKAAVYYGRGDIRIESMPEPSNPRPGEVVLEVTRAAICGTDSSEWAHGPMLTRPPVTLGHEFVGRVVSIGDEVTGLSQGDRVVSGAAVSCGHCEWCRAGRTNLCSTYLTLGLQLNGGLAQLSVHTGAVCRQVPESCSDEAAAMAQPLAVALHALRRTTCLSLARCAS